MQTGRKLEPEETRTILEGLLKGLAHLARCRIIHRDLKPENVMFRRGQGWEVAICDFGLATYADEERYLFVRCGTPGFVAPEIINIRDMTTKSHPISDIFSAGVIFHHLLLGCSVFEGKKYNEILAQNRACDFDFTRDPYTKLPPAAFELLTRMLEKDPARRISAETALVHPYFTGTELEHEPKLFRELSNYSSPSHLKQKDLERTPSSLGQSLQGKAPFLELRREQRQLRY
jgi:calcium-dependent protein kinase